VIQRPQFRLQSNEYFPERTRESLCESAAAGA